MEGVVEEDAGRVAENMSSIRSIRSVRGIRSIRSVRSVRSEGTAPAW